MSDTLSSHGLQPARFLRIWNSLGKKTECIAFPFPWELPNPGIKPGSSTLQADSLLSEPPGKPYIYIYICLCVCIYTHIHSSMDTGFFHILAILNNMAMNRKMRISFQDNDYFFQHTHSCGIIGSYGYSIFQSGAESPYCFPQSLNQFTLPSTVYKELLYSFILNFFSKDMFTWREW